MSYTDFDFPHTSMYNSDLREILANLKMLNIKLNNFINLNTIKYADPIQWNITTQYEANTVVIDGNTGTAYLSTKPVPSGVALTNTDYWTVIFTLDILSANQNITFRNDGANVIATFESNVDDWLLWNSQLYKVIRHIAINEAYVEGYNLERYSVELFIKDYISNLETIIGALSDLTTSDTDSIVDAINSIITERGALSDLDTTDKTSIVNAINEIFISSGWTKPEQFGAIGDGVADDSDALIACMNYANTNHMPILLVNNYLVTKQINLFDGCRIYGSGNILCQYDNPSATTIEARESATFNCTNCSDIIIDGITFTGTGTSTNRYTKVQMVGGNNCSNIIVQNCIFKDVQCEGAVIFFASHNILVTHCQVLNYTYTGVAFWNSSYECEVSHCKIYNGTLTTSGSTHIDRYAISLCGWDDVIPSGTPMPKNLKANYNYIEDLNPEWEGIDAHGGQYIEIIGNLIINMAIPIAVFTDDNRHFHVYFATIQDNVCYQQSNKMNMNKLWYSSAFSGDDFDIANNIFKNDWYSAPSDTSLSSYFGIAVGLVRGHIHGNSFINLQNGSITFTGIGGRCVVENNYFVSSASALTTNSRAITTAQNEVYSVRVKNNTFDGVYPYRMALAGSGSLFEFIDNCYPDTFSNCVWTDILYALPDWCDSTELATITSNALGHIIKNKNHAVGQPWGWMNTSRNVWSSLGNIT